MTIIEKLEDGAVLNDFKSEYTVTKDTGSIKYFVNGNLQREYTKSDFINRFNISEMDFTIGKWHDSFSSSSYFSNNNINSFRIYNRALTDEEVAHNYRIDKSRFGIE